MGLGAMRAPRSYTVASLRIHPRANAGKSPDVASHRILRGQGAIGACACTRTVWVCTRQVRKRIVLACREVGAGMGRRVRQAGSGLTMLRKKAPANASGWMRRCMQGARRHGRAGQRRHPPQPHPTAAQHLGVEFPPKIDCKCQAELPHRRRYACWGLAPPDDITCSTCMICIYMYIHIYT
jgi:hypothetical protein